MTALRTLAMGGGQADVVRLSGTLLLQVSAAGMLFALHVVSARVLPLEDYGALAFGLTLGGILTLVCTLGYPNLVMRQLAGYAVNRAYPLLKGLLLHASWRVGAASLVMATLLAGVAALGGNLAPGQRSGLAIAGLVVLFYPLGALRAKAVRGLGGLAGSIVPEDLVRPALFVSLLLGVHWLSGAADVRRATALLALAMVASLVIGIVWGRRYLPFVWREVEPAEETSRWRRSSRRIMVGALLQELTYRTDIVVLGLVAVMSATAMYSAAAKLATIAVFGLQVIDIYYAPRMAAAHARGDRDALRTILRATIIASLSAATPVVMVLLLVPGELLALFGAEYPAASLVLQVLAAGYFVSAATGSVGHALLMTGHEAEFARITGLTAIATLAGHAVVTPLFGMVGAAIVAASAIALQNLVMLYVVRTRVLGNA